MMMCGKTGCNLQHVPVSKSRTYAKSTSAISVEFGVPKSTATSYKPPNPKRYLKPTKPQSNP